MVTPTPPPPIISPQSISNQEIKERSPVTKPDTAHPVGAPQESNRSKKTAKDKDGRNKKHRDQTPTEDDQTLDIMV